MAGLRRWTIGLLVLLLAAQIACLHKRDWSEAELRTWVVERGHRDPFFNGLHYLGSDEDFHYFLFRSADSWIHPRVARDEIQIADVRLYDRTSSAELYGYYPVDPADGWKRAPVFRRKATGR